ncbi:TPA: adenylate cyclase [Candidatus Nomurabacteria bacterium]|nr:adenylate cyclase [Candidatus Nomurabacteria bacterium]
MKNLEIKVLATNIEEMKRKALEINAEDFGLLHQIDTYFIVGEKRLKLREEKERNYLVYYVRPNTLDSKFCKYTIINIPLRLTKITKQILSLIFGVKVTVNKTRNLFIYKNTRIHLDKVKDLDLYAELETVIKKEEDTDELKKEHNFIIQTLGLDKLESIKESYSDLLLSK